MINYLKKGLGAIKSKLDMRDFDLEVLSERLACAVPPQEFPKEFRIDTMCVINQGSIGSCVACSLSSLKNGHEIKDVRLDEPTSPLFIYNQRKNYGEGMFPRDAFGILKDKGICLESTFPYDNLNYDSKPSEEAFKEAEKYKIDGYARISSVDGIKTALMKYGPVLFCADVWNYSPLFYKKRNGMGDTKQGRHATLIVGWDKEGFIIKNSWGTSWGTDGYTHIAYDDLDFDVVIYPKMEFWTAIDMITRDGGRDLKKEFFWYKLKNAYKSTYLKWFIIGALSLTIITIIVIGLTFK